MLTLFYHLKWRIKAKIIANKEQLSRSTDLLFTGNTSVFHDCLFLI